MGEYYEPIADGEKLRICSSFIKHAPPGEFNEVFNDVRVLLDNDQLLKEQASSAFSQYNMEQFTPCKLNSGDNVLITKHGALDNNTFYDPKTKQKFKYDHLRKEATDLEAHDTGDASESWRSAVESAVANYVKDHYPHGVLTVYGKSSGSDITITACVEDHQFQPQNFWNGRWRSEWSVTFNSSGGNAELKGLLKLQVHYYEDGNVQLVSHKDVTKEINVSDANSLGRDLAKHIDDSETEYQRAIGENYQMMSDTTFKALRRQLPITRTKIDWNKIVSYRIGAELKS
ncbi:F-actin-capping protein subunit alpha-like [Clytia hemisphaerica]|uniref:F-actin-capping protein subunit alpha n=1 Tax=Clytia hemisphaerica TaxID=252671 RepID=A0A7M5X9L7_9CNID|eukprot:TCONS_00050802-protein